MSWIADEDAWNFALYSKHAERVTLVVLENMSESIAAPSEDSSSVAESGDRMIHRTVMERWRPSPARLTDNKPMKVLQRIWFGKRLERPTYHIAGAIFLRMLGLVYLIAFVSLWTQVSGLVGDHGILPVADFLDAVQKHFAAQDPPASPVWNVPTLLWISPHDGMLHLLCAAGTLLSLMLIAGLLQMPSLVLLWASYLSLFYAGQTFLGFQWDILLMETGFVAIFLAPLAWRSKFLAKRHPPRLALWLLWWLLFRLMFESGAVKLTWNTWQLGPDGSPVGNTWESLTALDYHYWTQPLPIWTSWYAAKLPEGFQKLSVAGTFVIELVLPWFIFGPRVLRYIACGGITLLMLLIGATGNYNFFNLLTFALAQTLLDDRAWPRFLKKRLPTWGKLTACQTPDPRKLEAHADARELEAAATARKLEAYATDQSSGWRWRHLLLVPFAGLAIVAGTLQVKEAIAPAEQPRPSLESDLHIAQFVLVNDYGLFRRMTETRPEIVIEGSADGQDRKPYEFRWKPGDLSRRPRFNTPHQPRLDWQMWFEALRLERVHQLTGAIDPRYMSPWFQALLMKFLKGEPQVVGLLGENPFPAAPPKFVRIVLYQYRFTDAAQRRATGDWWHREQVWVGPEWSLPP